MFPPQNALILELNTRVWLRNAGRDGRPAADLTQVSDACLDEFADLGVDLLWLMGVWTRSSRGRDEALNHLPQYREALPDATAADVIGSPYAVRAWQVAPEPGGRAALAHLRRRLRERGIGLILDYVPNHVARDHAWLRRHPEWFIQGSEQDLRERPADFFIADTQAGRRIVAHGRDPWFPGWTDTAQVNAFHRGYRAAALETLLDLAGQCDGLRCDMAMLLRNEVFAATWREQLAACDPPATEFWQELIPAVRDRHPGFRFIAEVYWDMEADMLQLGFDLCYDKALYDAMLYCDLARLRRLLAAPHTQQQRLLRFTENHDERRALSAFGPERCRAAFVLAATLPGATLLHDGQLTGRRVKLPVQLARQPQEAPDRELEAFQRRLLRELRAAPFRQGQWRLFEAHSMPDNENRHGNLVVHGWACADDWRLIAVNAGADYAIGRVPLGAWPELSHGDWLLEDIFDGACYRRDGAEMAGPGLGIVLPPWGAHCFRFRRA